MRHFHIKSMTIGLACSALLSGCGGSLGGALGQASTAEGLFVGTNSKNQATTMFVVNTGAYYQFYSAANNSSVIAGALQGTTSQSSGSVTSGDSVDVNLQGLGAQAASLSGSYVTAQSNAGTITYTATNTTTTFSSTYNPAGYQAAANLTNLAGTYVGTGGSSALAETQTMTISSTGVIAGTGAGGCNFSGAALLLSKGNGYSLALAFGDAPCALANSSIAGIAYLDPATKRLYVSGLLANRTDGFVFMGAKS
jgi:hypothetical protein